ncbi:MAG: hypothetical protein GTN60_12225 [Pseudomonas stutzeri]|nr:hypothetical protein [Stutzerimonas stutzeri]NIM53170.1 hypothetical protein [Stutzerimonas stutzeri]NIM87490.1 hypothetical protein [Stutzerimonas stutzeri]NIN82182.1 hypothetical protein [Stutzerimonas stutzeri]NIP01425.1 hypothetical protein [Stutzerimonas stutzeri]
MKVCTVVGDLSSNNYSEQFPRITMCDACVAEDQSLPDDVQRIRQFEELDSPADRCDICFKRAGEEVEERAAKEG